MDRRAEELDDLLHVVEYFDALSLIFVGWLDHPHVLLAVLGGNLFFVGIAEALFQILESFDELMVFVGVEIRAHDECGRRRVEDLIAMLDCTLVVLVIRFEAPDQSSLGRDFSVVFEVADDELTTRIKIKIAALQAVEAIVELLLDLQSSLLRQESLVKYLVDLAVHFVVEVRRLPDEVASA